MRLDAAHRARVRSLTTGRVLFALAIVAIVVGFASAYPLLYGVGFGLAVLGVAFTLYGARWRWWADGYENAEQPRRPLHVTQLDYEPAADEENVEVDGFPFVITHAAVQVLVTRTNQSIWNAPGGPTNPALRHLLDRYSDEHQLHDSLYVMLGERTNGIWFEQVWMPTERAIPGAPA